MRPMQAHNLAYQRQAVGVAQLGHGTKMHSSFCSQTPYPEICNSFTSISTNDNVSRGTVDDTEFAFNRAMLQVTMAQSERAHQHVVSMDVTSFNDRAKVAWGDCVELYEDTVDRLNCSLGSSSLNEDVQTWLSGAINNEQTCQNGFLELGLPSNLISFNSSLILSNLSKLISNSLAINKASISKSTPSTLFSTYKSGFKNDHDEFPTWVSKGDRKLLQSPSIRADVVVAKDGSGNYRTISEAVAASAKQRSGSQRDGIDATVVSGSKSVKGGSTTFRSATFAVTGGGFIARDITFENTAGPQNGQAVALRSGSDLSVFYSCSFKGYQDTLYVYAQRQFYRNCDIYGTVDFIFGDAVAVLQNCNIYVRRPMSHQFTTVTAQGRKDPNENTGISIHNSRVTAASDLRPVQGSVRTYLGRPWQKYSRVVFIKTYLDGLINPAGWLAWNGNFALNTLYYGEYMNSGPGAATGNRVKWPGYHGSMGAAEAGKFTVGSFLGGGSWIPATGVPFTSGL
ncbi:hypothetical protein Scep_022870 [Stephania cephalantha]|uniref:Pectinesterase n=1 Tax=Stephania cephalantha TaxID=152367 RepID=A0AAP0F679_9MAGN